MKKQEQTQNNNNNNINIFRDTPLRYLGYANEVGESFRYPFPRLVRPSYLVAFAYCCADAVASGYNAYYNNYNINNNNIDNNNINNNNNNTTLQQPLQSQPQSQPQWPKAVLYETADTLLWQSLASVAIPGACIQAIVKATRYGIVVAFLSTNNNNNNRILTTWLPTGTGLASIPWIVQPIDQAVDHLLDRTTRQWWNTYSNTT